MTPRMAAVNYAGGGTVSRGTAVNSSLEGAAQYVNGAKVRLLSLRKALPSVKRWCIMDGVCKTT